MLRLGRRYIRWMFWCGLVCLLFIVMRVLGEISNPDIINRRFPYTNLDDFDSRRTNFNRSEKIPESGKLFYVEPPFDNSIVNNITYPPYVEWSDVNGPGEWGYKLELNRSEAEEREVKKKLSLHGYDQDVSDHIAVHRRLKDDRVDACKNQAYPDDLPDASVIICFHNEAWSVLLRSVHSVLDRAPDHLIREVILVDDASSVDYLKEPLRKYFSKNEKVKIVRMKEHQGLIRARLAGYDVAKGEVLVFLDSHIECYPEWLEPMLSRIKESPKAVVYPRLRIIKTRQFSIDEVGDVIFYGYFAWRNLTFRWTFLSEQTKSSRKSLADPIPSPTMPGGLFAVDRAWFTTLGTYDPDLLFWGAEHMELSFKTWMCNGSIEQIPCSHIAHIFRYKNPVQWMKGGNPLVTNAIRVANTWMDEYRYIMYEQSLLLPDGPSQVDVSERLTLRESLHCKSYHWYLENICPQCSVPRSSRAGEVRNTGIGNNSYCLDSGAKGAIYDCHGQGGQQYWLLTEQGMVCSRFNCICLRDGQVMMSTSRKAHDSCIWIYTDDKRLMLAEGEQCLTLTSIPTLALTACGDTPQQQWEWEASKFTSLHQ